MARKNKHKREAAQGILDNADRAGRGLVAFNAYRELPGVDEEPETALRDVMADLLHYAEMEGQDPFELLRLAEMHYNSERMSADENCTMSHAWGPVQRARATGNPHRKCMRCGRITLDLEMPGRDTLDPCPDCGKPGERRGHQDCQYPKDAPGPTTHEEHLNDEYADGN